MIPGKNDPGRLNAGSRLAVGDRCRWCTSALIRTELAGAVVICPRCDRHN